MSMISTLVPYVQVALSVLLTILVLLQQSGGSSGGALGSGDNFSSVFHTRRGMEKALFIATIVVAILFVLSTFAALVL
ncbi:MAG TPA: preprotein translocase subunit SecG [Candidatus Paceibacterota bacterium]|jgi:protein translocase SecG subunit|nr:preprotein translocase subunit SecG [Candidatus Paceibacterota bacterium]